jgi:transcriptional regulator with XRE-family HTH domain
MSLADQVRIWRTTLNLSQGDIESRAGLAHNALSRIENAQVASPRLETLQKIAGAMGIHVEQLMNVQPHTIQKKSSELVDPAVQEIAQQISRLPSQKRQAVVDAIQKILAVIEL